LRLIAKAGGKIKYGHAEVGCFSDDDYYYEQHEVEFLPTAPEQAAEQMIIAKWILRNLGYRYGVTISFAPKITVGKAGSGMHFHLLAEKDGKNMLVENGKLGPLAKRMIAGILDVADGLTAFGNTIPTSYLRLVPHQEAPTNICWGDRNRSVVIRVPLGWSGAGNMISDANPADCYCQPQGESKQTFEFRVPDGSADVYLTVAGLIVGALHGLNSANSIDNAEKLYVDVNIFKPEFKEKLATLKQLPASCFESAEALEAKRAIFENNGVFPKGMIDSKIKKLKAYDDKGMSEKLFGKNEEIAKLVHHYLHIG